VNVPTYMHASWCQMLSMFQSI